MKLNYMQCWNGAMALFGAHKEAIVAIAGVFVFLPTLLMAQFVGEPLLNGNEDLDAMMAVYSAYFSENLIAIVTSNLFISFGVLAICFALTPSDNFTVAENLRRTFKAFVVFIIANLLAGFAFFGGLMLFIIPGFYIFCRLILVPVFVADTPERNPLEILKNSWAATKGNGFSIMMFLLIIYVVGIVTIGVLQAVTGVITGLATSGAGWPLIGSLVAALTGTIFQIILTTVTVSIYIELTGKKQNVEEIFS
ncbi:hypothetical protein [Parasphingorhabdus sp.]|jgi:hypothetical protein|uniref:hypothetical protein n=1 Tax=Parasphingorhabdus sp. TaxID=2709688 RepID=UPI003D294736